MGQLLTFGLNEKDQHHNVKSKEKLSSDAIQEEEKKIILSRESPESYRKNNEDYWQWLKQNHPKIYMQRKCIVENRVYEKIQEFGGDIKSIPGDGNCLINSYLYHIGGNKKMSKQNALKKRIKLIQFMNKHKYQYSHSMDIDENINDYLEDCTYLNEIHLNALHEMNKINILVFEYHEANDQLSDNYYYQSSFKKRKCLFLVYYRHSKHYNYCYMDNAKQYKLPLNAGYHYKPKGTKLDILQQFDNQYGNDQNAISLTNSKPNLQIKGNERKNQTKTSLYRNDDGIYLRLINHYKADGEFRFIQSELGHYNIDITKYTAFGRRPITSTEIPGNSTQQILHKTNHMHARNIKSMLKSQYNQLQQSEVNDADQQHQGLYHIGIKFNYGYEGEEIEDDAVAVTRKYASLKEEVTQNEISILSMAQFEGEYTKATTHFNSFYRKECYPQMGIQLILSLMIYCNYTEFQYQFSKTYREDNGSNHNVFYWMGCLLKMAVHQFGTRIRDGNVSSFYHGMSEQLTFPKYIRDGGVNVFCPLSTSSSSEVAANFTANRGLIIEFEEHIGLNKYFSVGWLSDYTNESEYLFIQSKYPFFVGNIVNSVNGYEYNKILNAIRIIEQITTNQPIENNIDPNLIHRLLKNQLPTTFALYTTFDSLCQYAKEIINIYCNNKKIMILDYWKMKVSHYFKLLDLFWHRKYEWIKLREINAIFPNIEEIRIHNVRVHPDSKALIFDDLLEHWRQYKSMIKMIKIHNIVSGIDVNDIDLICKYQKRFNSMKYSIYIDANDCLCIHQKVGEHEPGDIVLQKVLNEPHEFNDLSKVIMNKNNKFREIYERLNESIQREKQFKKLIQELHDKNNSLLSLIGVSMTERRGSEHC